MQNPGPVNHDRNGATALPCRRNALLSGCVALAVMVTMTAMAKPASACICVRQTLCERVQTADAVFEATPLIGTVSAGTATYTVIVGTVYKGAVSLVTVVQTKAYISSCGVNFTPGIPYIVFGTSTAPLTVTTNGCSGTAREADFSAADLQQITRCTANARMRAMADVPPASVGLCTDAPAGALPHPVVRRGPAPSHARRLRAPEVR
jgi:hypothetical protein